MKSVYSCGVDIGGTHITTALVNVTTGEILQSSLHRSLVNAFGKAEDIIRDWAEMIRKSLAYTHGNINIGIAMPGPFDYDQGISLIKGQYKFDALYGLDVKQMLADTLQLPSANITFANDTSCFLQGEVFCGCAKGRNTVMGITLGTGLGCALFMHGIAEDGNLWESPFLDGIAEDYLSARWLTTRFQQLSGEIKPDVKSISEISQNNEHARKVFQEFGSNLGDFLSCYLKGLEVEMVLLGGSISQSFSLFEQQVLNRLAKNNISIPVVRSTLQEQAALIGAVDINTLVSAL